jgi:hypothetical protein
MNSKLEQVVRLSVPAPLLKFSKTADDKAEEALLLRLRQYEKTTTVFPILNPEELYLNKEAKVQGQYQLSSLALSSLCSKLIPGLMQTVTNLSGLNKDETECRSDPGISPIQAIRWINDAIKLRFNKLKGCSIVVDAQAMRIDGLVGRKYEFLSNLDLFTRVAKFIACNRKMRFNEAALHGRRLLLRYVDATPLLVMPDNSLDIFYGGLHFANSEVGDCSVRASAVIARRIGDTKSISAFADGSKIAHVKGRSFETKFTELFERVSIKTNEISKYSLEFSRLADTLLQLGGTAETHKARLRILEKRLLRWAIKTEHALLILNSVLVYGSSDSKDLLTKNSQDPMLIYSKRTAFDLYNAICRVAKTLTIDEQEHLEQIAFKFLTGKLSL